MSLTGLQASVALVEINCGECGGVYAISERYRDQKHEQGGSWTCPYCRVGWGFQESQINKIRKEKEAAERRAKFETNRRKAAEDARLHAERSARTYRGHNTRLKKRASAGVCPCCNRTFQNVKQHMENKHPEFAKTGE